MKYVFIKNYKYGKICFKHVLTCNLIRPSRPTIVLSQYTFALNQFFPNNFQNEYVSALQFTKSRARVIIISYRMYTVYVYLLSLYVVFWIKLFIQFFS